jgi:ribonuclease D
VKKTITKEEISALEIEEFNGPIHVIDSLKDADKAIKYLSRFQYLGFDTETKPSFKKGETHRVALIQLATPDQCFLFRIFETGFYPSLILLLSNPDILKVGVSIKDDFDSMNRRLQFAPQGFFDLQKIVDKYDIGDASLQKIYAILFQKKISKRQRLSNWETETLSEKQQKYAALDAWACLKIYETLCNTNESISTRTRKSR